jgi:hypothetical protein
MDVTYLQTLAELLLLLIDYTEAEVNLIGLLELGSHAHNLRKGFFGMVKGSITIVENANSIPELGFLGGN